MITTFNEVFGSSTRTLNWSKNIAVFSFVLSGLICSKLMSMFVLYY